MNHIHSRLFLPALVLQAIVALSLTAQPSLAQEAQTAASLPAQQAKVTDEKTASDEACEQSPSATTTRRNGGEQHGVHEVKVFKLPPVRFVSPREVNPATTQLSVSDPKIKSSFTTFNGSDLSLAADPVGWQQTGASSYTPLTSSEKMRRAFKSAFLSPQAYLISGVSAIITEAGEDDLPHKETDDRIADGLSRFAIKFGRRSTNNLLGGGVFPSLFRQDPRFERADGKGYGARALHAASRVFITRGDNGKLQPNYSRFAGQLASSALSNLWEQSTPGHDRIGADATFRRFGTSFATGALFNVLREFAPDIKKIFGK